MRERCMILFHFAGPSSILHFLTYHSAVGLFSKYLKKYYFLNTKTELIFYNFVCFFCCCFLSKLYHFSQKWEIRNDSIGNWKVHHSQVHFKVGSAPYSQNRGGTHFGFSTHLKYCMRFLKLIHLVLSVQFVKYCWFAKKNLHNQAHTATL